MGSNSHIGNTSSKYARVYQACEPCRIKKVRCNLGSVDNPSDPPCARCRRESKHCYFNVTRKRAPPPSTGNGDADAKAFIARNKRRKTVSSPGAGQDVPGSDGVVDLRRGENDSTESTQSLEAGSPADIESSDLQGKHEGFREALLQNAAYTDEDALDLLYRAGSTSTPGDQHGVPTNQPTPQDPTPQADPQDTAASRGREDALNIWSDVRFVRDGLFSAEEAIIYIDFFHDHLKPFTPILSSTDFKPLSTHKTLIEDNPVLAVTMLMLASRYCTLPGAGAVSRRYLIHERLWESLRTMIMRIFWAQDPCPRSSGVAGGGGGGGGLRTLGTCEALLILTEWHPRSLHFPMGGDDVHMLTSKTTRHKNSFTDQNPLFWLEWSWRSDRLCWSLLGTALTLAIELGLLDDCDNTTMGAREITSGSWRDPAFEDRAFRLGQYLWVYSTQLSGRLGWKYLAPYNLPERPSLLGDDTLNLWTGMAILMRTGNELLFASRQHTMEIIRNGRYIGLLYTFQTSLHEWRKEFDNANLSSIMRMILAIDFGYMRVYFNSLAAQAIMDNTRDGKLPLHRSNEDFVMEIIDGARSILECVLNHLVPDGRLAHIPIRTYSRILTAILFLLKTTYLNVTSPASIESSLVLMARVGKAFQQCSPDDAHLSARWGVLLTTLSSRQIGFMRRKNASQLRDDGMVGNSAVDLQQHSVESHEGGFMAANNNLGELQPQPGSVNSLESLGWYELSNVGHSMDNFCLGGNDVQMMPGVPGVTDEQLDLTIPFSAPYQLYTYL